MIVLALEAEWRLPYHELIELWTLGALMVGVGALPAENILLARYTPARRHGLAFGAKFVLAFGAAPLAVQLVSYVQGRTGDFFWLFVALSGCALVALMAAMRLPRPAAAAGSHLPARSGNG